MSTNISDVIILTSDGFCIARPLLVSLRAEHLEQAPDTSFLNQDWPQRCCEEHRGLLFVNGIEWEGEGSGYSLDLFESLLARFTGSVDLMLLWEGYEPSGLRLLNGVVTQHKIVSALGEATK